MEIRRRPGKSTIQIRRPGLTRADPPPPAEKIYNPNPLEPAEPAFATRESRLCRQKNLQSKSASVAVGAGAVVVVATRESQLCRQQQQQKCLLQPTFLPGAHPREAGRASQGPSSLARTMVNRLLSILAKSRYAVCCNRLLKISGTNILSK